MTNKRIFSARVVISFLAAMGVFFSVASANRAPRQKMDQILVFGDGFIFELAALRTVTSSLLAMGGKRPAVQEASDFDSALKAADENLKSKKGEKYDAAFARKAGPWISRSLAGCTKGLPASDLGPFTVLVRIAESGEAEEVMVRPETKVALCLKPSFVVAKGPKPPGPSWWVKLVIAIR